MEITYQDQRKTQKTQLSVDWDNLYLLAEKAGVPEGTEVRVRVRTYKMGAPYGFSQQVGPNAYRVVLNLKYRKPQLSEGAQYVVNNTLLHELRHVAQGQESGWGSLSSAYDGWSETEAREYGQQVKDQSEFFALT